MKISGWTKFNWWDIPNSPNVAPLTHLVVSDEPVLIPDIPKWYLDLGALKRWLLVFPTLSAVTIYRSDRGGSPLTPLALSLLGDEVQVLRDNGLKPTFKLIEGALDINRQWNPLELGRDEK